MPSNRRKKNLPVAKSNNQDKPHSAPSDTSFEKELCWCVQQLELGLATQKPTAKQAEDAMKVLKVLKNPKASLVRKRQVMRNTFGDYRQQIAQEERKAVTDTKGKMKVNPAPTRMLQQSVFYKRSKTHITKGPKTMPLITMAQSDGDFRFDFKEKGHDGESVMEACASQSHSEEVLPPFVFQPSSEPFKFNFGAAPPSKDEKVSQADYVVDDQQTVPSSSDTQPSAKDEPVSGSNSHNDSDRHDRTVPPVNSLGNQLTKEPTSGQATVLLKNVEMCTHVESENVNNSPISTETITKIGTSSLNKQDVVSSPKTGSVSETSDTYCKVQLGGGNFRFNFHKSMSDSGE